MANGPMPSSLILGYSRCQRPTDWRANPDEETTDWRARRERTAHRVRREGTVKAVPYPYSTSKLRGAPLLARPLERVVRQRAAQAFRRELYAMPR